MKNFAQVGDDVWVRPEEISALWLKIERVPINDEAFAVTKKTCIALTGGVVLQTDWPVEKVRESAVGLT